MTYMHIQWVCSHEEDTHTQPSSNQSLQNRLFKCHLDRLIELKSLTFKPLQYTHNVNDS